MDETRTETIGVIHVDGQPAEGIVVTLYDESGNAPVAQGITQDDGAFTISTNRLGDGVLPGKYAATMVWSSFDPISRSQTGDRLSGKYADPSQGIEWEIPAAGVCDLGKITLTTR